MAKLKSFPYEVTRLASRYFAMLELLGVKDNPKTWRAFSESHMTRKWRQPVRDVINFTRTLKED